MTHDLARYEEPARGVALWMLYALDVAGGDVDDALTYSYATCSDLQPELYECWDRVEARVRGITEMLSPLNEQIQGVSPRWRLERMAIIDRNILRLGAWEILESYDKPIITINACIELGKDYGEKGTPAFINGLLDQLRQNHGIPVS